jgi:hypothetical protein
MSGFLLELGIPEVPFEPLRLQVGFLHTLRINSLLMFITATILRRLQ